MSDHAFSHNVHLPRCMIDIVDDEWRKEVLENHEIDIKGIGIENIENAESLYTIELFR